MRYLPLICALLITTSLAGCGEDEAKSEHLKAMESGKTEISLKLAHASEAAGDFASAERYYKQAITKNSDVEPRLELADFYRRHRGERQAMDVLNEARKLYPDNTDVMRVTANVDINMGKPEQAVTLIDEALKKTSNDPLLYNTKGVALDMLGKYTQARNAYATAIELDPDDIMIFDANLAMSYITTGMYTKAINLLLPLAMEPDATPQIRQNLALAYGLKGDNANALRWAKKDLSEKDAEENVKFYNMLAKRGGVKSEPSDTVRAIPPIPPLPPLP